MEVTASHSCWAPLCTQNIAITKKKEDGGDQQKKNVGVTNCVSSHAKHSFKTDFLLQS